MTIKVETPLRITTTVEDLRHVERAQRRHHRAMLLASFAGGAGLGLLFAGAPVSALLFIGFVCGWGIADAKRPPR